MNNNNKRRRNNNAKRNLGSTKRMQNRMLHDACAVTDPFCPAAKFATHPGGTGGVQTIRWTAKKTLVLSTSATGVGYLYFRPEVSTAHYTVDEPAVGTDATMVIGMGSSLTAFPTGVESGRVISAGIRWFDMATKNAAQSLIAVIPTNSDDSLADGEVLTKDEVFGHPDASVTTNYNNGQTYICQPHASAEEFRTLDAGTAALEDTQFTGVLIGVDGPNSKAVIGVEMIIHYEFQIDLFSNTPGVVGNPENVIGDPLIKDVWYSGIIGGLYESRLRRDVETMVKEKAKRALIAFGKTAVRGLLSYGTGGASNLLLANGNYGNVLEID